MVGIEAECGRVAWSGAVIGMPLGIVVGGRSLGMAWFDVWKGKLALRGNV